MTRPSLGASGLLAGIALLAACAVSVTRTPTDAAEASRIAADAADAARADVQAMLSGAAANWNRGDLDAFMADYLPGSRTTYVGRTGVLRGPDAIRSVYAARFAPGGVRDSLSFEGLEVDLLSPDAANAIAWYVLSRGDSTIARGPTSLVMVRRAGRWRIVHDHSS